MFNIWPHQLNKKPKVLITGGLGFIFSHVTEYFVEKGWEVVVLDSVSEGSHPEIINGSFKFHCADLSDRQSSHIIVSEQPDYVIHAAANSDVDRSIREPLATFLSNALSTMHVFEACLKLPNLKRLLYISTDEVYGDCTHRRREDEILWPKNPYSLAKAAGSLMRIAFDNTYPSLKDKTAETRFCNVFGPRQDPRKIIPAIKRALDEGIPVPLHQEGRGYREYIYIKEIPPLVETILTHPEGNRTYNITANAGYTVKELIDLAEDLTGRNVPTIPAHRSGMDEKYQMSNERLQETFHWQPSYPFKEAYAAYLKGQPL